MSHEGHKAQVDAFLASLSDNSSSVVEAVASTVDHSMMDHSAHAGMDHSAHSGMDHSSHAGMDHSSHGTHGGHDAHAGHMMKMWFHGGYEEVILFDWWRTDSWTGLLLSCLLIFIMGAAYEGIKWFRVYMQLAQDRACRLPPQNGGIAMVEVESAPLHCKKESSQENVYNPTTTPPTRPVYSTNRSAFSPDEAFSTKRFSQALLYVIQLVLAYWLMLIVMTYNSYLTAAVILGAGFGHWLFAVLKIQTPLGETADSLATDACH